MSEKIKNIPIGSISIIAILLFLILLINNVQITLGRYMSSVDGKAVFLFNAKQNPELDYGEWEEVDGRPTLSVNINKNIHNTYNGPQTNKMDLLLNVSLIFPHDFITKTFTT